MESQHGKRVPMVATGHLFATGAHKASDDDGMRDLYVGTLGAVGADSFPECFDYVALGHIHARQIIGGQARIRYSGSPIAMGFGEVGQEKCVLLVDFLPDECAPVITPVTVPAFR